MRSMPEVSFRDVLIRERQGGDHADNDARSWRQACLDHVLPRSAGGSNGEGNLITSCLQCNEKRGDMKAIVFAYEITSDHPMPGTDAWLLLDRIVSATGRELPPAKVNV